MHSLLCHSNSTKIMSQRSAVNLWHNLWQTRYFSPLNDHCFHIQHVKMSFSPLLLTNLKQNYSVIAHGYKDKARSRRRESYKESTAERERDTVYIPFSKIVLLINRAGYRDWQNAFDRSNSWTEDGLKSMVFIRSLLGVSIFSPCLPPSLFHPL